MIQLNAVVERLPLAVSHSLCDRVYDSQNCESKQNCESE